MKRQVIEFCGVLYDVRTKRDGGGRIQIDFGADSLLAVVELQKLNAMGDINLGIAIVPFRGDNRPDEGEFIPDEHGEIEI
jgi:hypothetical protein